MTLAELLEQNAPKPLKPAFDVWFEALSSRDREALIAAASDEAWTNVRLREVILKAGGRVSRDALSAWRHRVVG
jgi:hypothetical protein